MVKSDKITISKRNLRYLTRTIKKNNIDNLKDKNYIKHLDEYLEYIVDYSNMSYNYNIYLLNCLSNQNLNQG